MCGIRGTALLINSYLSNRDQYVVCDDYKSDVLPANVGVLQGSVLGPLLFNIVL